MTDGVTAWAAETAEQETCNNSRLVCSATGSSKLLTLIWTRFAWVVTWDKALLPIGVGHSQHVSRVVILDACQRLQASCELLAMTLHFLQGCSSVKTCMWQAQSLGMLCLTV